MEKTDMEQGGVSAEPAPQDKMSVLKKQADDVIDIMKNNLENKLKGQLMADNLLTKSEEVEKAAQSLDRTTKKVENSYRWKNISLNIFIMVIIIIMLIIVLLATGVIPISAPLPPIVTPTTKP
ncbi:uncharacterized protein LOC118470511 [Amphiprion ocellaris]|uniref:uncharacterized protein LOC118470511 n=1 Tax=Amphiprion ocellaris TaxID=80972 RepID=UPI001649A249|nr:uncharacterized protein LOC118470511 [Amphiprion ocellaris]